jgi:hypothetical protein
MGVEESRLPRHVISSIITTSSSAKREAAMRTENKINTNVFLNLSIFQLYTTKPSLARKDFSFTARSKKAKQNTRKRQNKTPEKGKTKYPKKTKQNTRKRQNKIPEKDKTHLIYDLKSCIIKIKICTH